MFRFFNFILASLLMLSGIAYASKPSITTAEASEWANSKGKELLMTLSEKDMTIKHQKLDKMLVDYVNLNFISKFVIGKYAKLMNSEQEATYINLFQRYVLSLYKRFNLNIDASKVNFTITSIVEHPKYTTVECNIDVSKLLDNPEQLPIPAKFKLLRGTNNAIQTVDLEIAEVSLVIEYRKRFYQMIRDESEDINWFLEKFSDMVEANENNVTANQKFKLQNFKKL
jgi:ABC-type transporter MlaC component